MKILTINGSGTGGYRAARFLQHLEYELEKPLGEYFDFISGVSSGSLIGAYLAKGYSCEEAVEKFKELAPKIFSKGRGFFMNLFYPKYDSKVLREEIAVHFDFFMSDLETKFMTYALAIDGNNNRVVAPRHWKSWKDSDIEVYNPLIASCSAPTFFEAHTFEDVVDGENQKRSFVDGALVTNNPSMCSLAEALKLGNKLEDIRIINVGSGKQVGGNPKNYSGFIKVAQHLPFDVFAASERVDEYQAQQIIDVAAVTFSKNTSGGSVEYFKEHFNIQLKYIFDALIAEYGNFF